MTYERMVEIAKNHLGGEIKWCNDAKLNEIFEAISLESGGSVSISWIKLQGSITQELVFEDEIWLNFTDEQMKKLFKSRLGVELESDKFKDSTPPGTTMFHPAQGVLGHATRLGYNETLEYFMDHINIENVDFDRLMVLSAIQNKNEKAIELILKHADETYKTEGGSGNCFFYKIKNEVNAVLADSEISDDLKQRLVNEFSWIEPINKLEKFKEKLKKLDTEDLLKIDPDSLTTDEHELYKTAVDEKLKELKSKLANLQKDM